MNVVVWVVTVLLAGIFLGAGLLKLTKSQDDFVAAGQGWANDVPAGLVKFIGVAEVLGAAGLVLPPLLGAATWLVPAAAAGLALTMLGAAVTHRRRGEANNVGVNVVLFGLAVFVVVMRVGPEAC